MKEITLTVCQGVGDIFWVYQKFAPYYDKINFNIPLMDKDGGPIKVQNRSIPFLKSWPKVGNVETVKIASDVYLKLSQTRFDQKMIMDSGEPEVCYCCNQPLEKAVRIEDIDPDLEIQETVDLPTEKVDLPEEYILLYVSGNSYNPFLLGLTGGLWSCHDWVRFVHMFYQKYCLTLPLVILGANYDKLVEEDIRNRLVVKFPIATATKRFDITTHYDKTPEQVNYILKNAKHFICYQSGLSILADNMDVKQTMVYFPPLDKLRLSWPKQKNIEDGTYQSFLFSDSPDEVIERLK